MSGPKRATGAARSRSRASEPTLDLLADRICRFRRDDHRIVYCNPAWAAPFGREPAELVGHRIEELLGDAERAAMTGQLTQLSADSPILRSQTERIDESGHAVWEEWTDHLVVGDDGGDEIVAVGRDVTSRVDHERMLQEAAERQRDMTEAMIESESRYRTYLAASTDGLVVLDFDGHIVDTNPAFHAMLGDDPAQPRLSHASEWDVTFTVDRYSALLNVDDRWQKTSEYRFRRLDGTEFPVEAAVRVIRVGDERRILAVIHDVTVRATAETRVAESEAQLRAILDTFDVGVLLHDTDGFVTFANAHAARLLGEPSPALLLGLHTDTWLLDTVVELDDGGLAELGPADLALVGRAQAGAPSPGPIDLAIPGPVAVRWLRANTHPLATFGAAQPSGVVLSFIDVTAERDALRRLGESETLHRNVVENLFEGVVVQEASGSIVAANPAAERILGLTIDQMMGRTSTDPRWRAVDGDGVTLPGDRHASMVALRTGEPVRNSIMGVHHPTGPLRWIEVNSLPFATPNGRTYVVAAFDDITDARRAQQALAASEARFRLLADHASDLVLTIALDGLVRYASPSALDLLGVPADGLIGRLFVELLEPADRPVVERELIRAGVGVDLAPQRSQFRVRRSDGVVRWFEALCRPITGADGVTAEVHAIARDVQDHRDAEERLTFAATHDPLTGLPNRTLLIDRLQHAIDQRRGHDHQAVLFVDLDRFKPVNDRFGHDAGDQVLITVADRLRQAVRVGDTVARVGGDEFVVIANHLVSQMAARALVDRIRDHLAASILIDQGAVEIGASVGLTFIERGDTTDLVLSRADRAMYDQKAATGTSR
jgi:diguanylate cyclase (GGDEF)-like protein/PAS domain S-box-containing protein